jgi:hypothetical protein
MTARFGIQSKAGPALKKKRAVIGGVKKLFVVQCSIVVCHRWLRCAHSLFKDAAPKAHPKMTNDN